MSVLRTIGYTLLDALVILVCIVVAMLIYRAVRDFIAGVREK